MHRIKRVSGRKANSAGAVTVPIAQRALRKRGLATRARILDAAFSEFAAKGLAGATSRDIAERAGVKHTLLIYHFATKDDLWLEVIESIARQFVTHLEARLQGLKGVDVVAKTRLMLTELVVFNAMNPEFHRLMLWESAIALPRLRHFLERNNAKVVRTIADLIRDCQRLGRFAAGDPYDLFYMLVGAATCSYLLAPEYAIITGQQPDLAQFLTRHAATCVGLFMR